MSRKVLQIGYELERDRLTWDDRDIHCGYGMCVHRSAKSARPAKLSSGSA